MIFVIVHAGAHGKSILYIAQNVLVMIGRKNFLLWGLIEIKINGELNPNNIDSIINFIFAAILLYKHIEIQKLKDES